MINAAYIRRDGCTGSTQFFDVGREDRVAKLEDARAWLEKEAQEHLFRANTRRGLGIGATLALALIYDSTTDIVRRYTIDARGTLKEV